MKERTEVNPAQNLALALCGTNFRNQVLTHDWKSRVSRFYFNSHHPDPHDPETGEVNNYEGEDLDGMFRFERRMVFLRTLRRCY